jgi:hypothetical protein
MKPTMTENAPRNGAISMTASTGTRHTVPLGMSREEFDKVKVIYTAYWTLHKAWPCRMVSGGGRPFAPRCMNPECCEELSKLTMLINRNEEDFHARTPILGWCACISCKRCVAEMPLEKQYRACPGCGDEAAHQEGYHMYPLTEEGCLLNYSLGAELRKQNFETARDGAWAEEIRRNCAQWVANSSIEKVSKGIKATSMKKMFAHRLCHHFNRKRVLTRTVSYDKET